MRIEDRPSYRSNTPEVTSTSTGRMMNWSSFGALVLILMKAVWLSASRDEKLALITPFVSNGGISYRKKSPGLKTLSLLKKKKKVKHLKLTHNFPVPPCCPVGSSRWRSPPLEYISTTWRRKKTHIILQVYKRNIIIKPLCKPTPTRQLHLQRFAVWVVNIY